MTLTKAQILNMLQTTRFFKYVINQVLTCDKDIIMDAVNSLMWKKTTQYNFILPRKLHWQTALSGSGLLLTIVVCEHAACFAINGPYFA